MESNEKYLISNFDLEFQLRCKTAVDNTLEASKKLIWIKDGKPINGENLSILKYKNFLTL